jgi:hypothetical protein
MRGLIGYLVGGLAVVLAMDYAAPPGGTGLDSASQAAALKLPVTNVVNRTAKSDKSALAPSMAGLDTEIATVEVIYRNREGRIVFQADATSEGAVRETRSTVEKPTSATETTPLSQSSPSVRKLPAQKIPEGCDPAFSPLAASARANNFTARCLAALESSTQLASAN